MGASGGKPCLASFVNAFTVGDVMQIVKTIFAAVLFASVSAFGQQEAASAPTLKPGSEVKLEAVAAAKWLQGEAPKSFEPGKIYIFECWATWCPPCIAAIPHMNDLHKKYSEKGLRIYGMNVLEEDEKIVAEFLKKKGDGMSYPVAFTGKDSAFEKEWLVAAGVEAIPHGFVVQNGKFLFSVHPDLLTDELVEKLLSGEEGVKKVTEEIQAQERQEQEEIAKKQEIFKLLNEFNKAADDRNTEVMATKIAEMEKLYAQFPHLPLMKFHLSVVKKDWPAVVKSMEETSKSADSTRPIWLMSANVLAFKEETDCPEDIYKSITKMISEKIEKEQSPMKAFAYITLCHLQSRAGEKDNALASAKKSVEFAKQQSADQFPSFLVVVCERHAKAVEGGKMPTEEDMAQWAEEAQAQSSQEGESEKEK